MNIIIGSHGFPPNQGGGAEWRTYRYAKWLSQSGHGVQVLAVDPGKHPSDTASKLTDEYTEGIRIRRLSYDLDQSAGHIEEYENPVAYQILFKLLLEQSTDILHIISGYLLTGSSIRAARDLRVPVILTLTDYWFLCPRITLLRPTGELCQVPDDPKVCTLCLLNSQRRYLILNRLTRGRFGDLLMKLWEPTRYAGFGKARQINTWIAARRKYQAETISNVDRLIAPSRFLAGIHQRQGAMAGKLTVIRQGINISNAPAREKEAPDVIPLVFGYVGQLAEHKGVTLLVKAFRRLIRDYQDIRLVIYGDREKTWPPYLKEIDKEIHGDGHISFGGWFDNSSVYQAYQNINLLVVPSIWYENSPNVILEAFANGKPVIASNTGGMAELIENGVNGLLFERGDLIDLAEKMEWVVKHPEFLVEFSKRDPGVKSIEDEMAELERLYQSLRLDRSGNRLC